MYEAYNSSVIIVRGAIVLQAFKIHRMNVTNESPRGCGLRIDELKFREREYK